MRLSNTNAIHLPLAMWLADEGYDFSPDDRSISVTSLMKPTRQILLRERLTADDRTDLDVADLIPSRLGHAIHDSIEKTISQNYPKVLARLGYPQHLIDAVTINPEGEPEKGTIPIYVEQRYEREILGYKISGKFDLILEGELNDFKSTSVYSYLLGGKEDDYALQGSLYRWLNPDKVRSDFVAINFVFTDWQRSRARQDPNYPQTRAITKRYPLKSVEETESWIRSKIRTLEKHAELPEGELPFCTDKELWRGETVYKYFSDPAKAHLPDAKCQKRFDGSNAKMEAYAWLSQKGKGKVVEVPGKVKACGYCPAFQICTQKDLYEHA